MKRKLKIVAGIPAFNEEATIAKIVVRARRHVDEVVVVDDGSNDDTGLIAEGLGVIVVRHEKNLGYGGALRSCFSAARDLRADILVTIDADGQHNPDQIPELVQPIKDESADLVLGSRFAGSLSQSEAPAYRETGMKLLTKLAEATSGARFSDAQSGFRAYGRDAIERIEPTEQGMGASVEILMKAVEQNLRIVEAPITVGYKGLRTSTHNPLYHGLDVAASIVKFTSVRHPLLFYGGLALVAFTLSIAFGGWALEIYAREGRLVTNLALISFGSGLVGVLAFFTAAILFALASSRAESRRPGSG